jgi:UDP-3-O-[3-hydroxymyristoyl] glucosamine N-acyltransferase
MEFTAQHIADLVQSKVVGNPKHRILGWSSLENAQEGDLSFLADRKYAHLLPQSGASVVLVSESLMPENPKGGPTLIPVPDARKAVSSLLKAWQQNQTQAKQGIHPNAWVDPEAKVHSTAWIGPGCMVFEGAEIGPECQLVAQVFVGAHVQIGQACVLHPGVRVLDGCTLGKKVILHANAVVGADGFGYQPSSQGPEKIPHVGNVVLEDEVEVGAGSTIDRAMMGSTRIGRGCKLDNLVHVAHNVQMGAYCLVAAQTGIAGSAQLGNGCQIGGQVGMIDHIRLADGTKVAAQSGLMKSVTEINSNWWGSPALPANHYKKVLVLLNKLPELEQKIRSIERKIEH